MTESQKIELRRSRVRERLGEISKLEGDAYTDEIRTEERALQDEYTQLEQRHRSALIAESEELETRRAEAGEGLKPEDRERMELRSKALLTNYFQAFARGRLVSGAEAELSAAAGVQGIPIELWDVPQPEQRQTETRAITPAPGTVGVNLDPIRPAVFAGSIAARLGVDMPRVASGTYATGTITTSADPEALGKSAAVTADAGAITVTTATPKRVSARLELTLEDIAAVGQANFESILRQNLSLALSDELDDQAINGDGSAPNLAGFFNRLTAPAAPAANVETWTRFLAIQSGGIDGLWATELDQIGIVCNPETFRLAAATFQGTDSEESAASYMKRVGGGFWTNKRMPDKANHIAEGILYRMGRSGMGASAGMRTAVCPHWGEISIDDIYSGSAKAERYFTMHVLLGDVILVQPDAYAQVRFRVST